MNKRTVFTICAKNYLGQALALKESVNKYNAAVDFYIYLADKADVPDLPDTVALDDAWISGWEKMAFKYDVIEFSTSIKPFCIEHLFLQGYEKVIYLDPDTYLFGSLDVVFGSLEQKSIVLTPHRCVMLENLQGPIPEEVVSNVGIYNLGFVGLRKDETSKLVVGWWKKRLAELCYNKSEIGLFVDQKWMDFIPGFFPDKIEISHHLGLNAALWNIQERNLDFEQGHPVVTNILDDKDTYPLIFFHFSGYNPYQPERLDKRSEVYTTSAYPKYKILLDEYRDAELRNGYDKYHILPYAFNVFDNGTHILRTNRRVYGQSSRLLAEKESPFRATGYVYRFFKKAKMLSSVKGTTSPVIKNKESKLRKIEAGCRLFIRLFGIDRYEQLLRFCSFLSHHTLKIESNE